MECIKMALLRSEASAEIQWAGGGKHSPLRLRIGHKDKGRPEERPRTFRLPTVGLVACFGRFMRSRAVGNTHASTASHPGLPRFYPGLLHLVGVTRNALPAPAAFCKDVGIAVGAAHVLAVESALFGPQAMDNRGIPEYKHFHFACLCG